MIPKDYLDNQLELPLKKSDMTERKSDKKSEMAIKIKKERKETVKARREREKKMKENGLE